MYPSAFCYRKGIAEMNFLDEYIISDWSNVFPLEFEDPTISILQMLVAIYGFRIGYLVFIKKETSRYINTEMLYVLLPIVVSVFAVILQLIPFLVISIIGFVFVWKTLKEAYLQIDSDEARGIYAYRQGIRKKQEEAFLRGEAIQNDGLSPGARPVLRPGMFHYKVDIRIFAILYWTPSVAIFCILNYLLPLILFK